jgi:hypothetical protein
MRILGRIGKILFVVLIIATLSGIVYYNRANYYVAYENLRMAIGLDKPCTKPIIYYIGDFDTRFGQSKKEFENNLARASSIWNNALGKTLFQYSETNPPTPDNSKHELKINLIYDDRQEVTDQLKVVNSTIDNSKDSYESLKVRFDSLKSNFEIQKRSLETLVKTYESQKDNYEKDVAYWNSQGGAPKKEFAELEARRIALNSQVQKINSANRELNSMITELNSMASTLNSLTKDINQKIGTFNTISMTNGPEFQEGEYISDESGYRINIYQYNDYTKLIRVLAHEFGHALNIEHTQDKESMMYAYNLDSALKLSTADIQALQNICESK